MAFLIAHSVAALRILPVHRHQDVMQPLRSRGNKHQVNVIRHQTIGDNTHFLPARRGLKKGQVRVFVPNSKENALTVIAALSDVVRNAGKHDTGMARHANTLAGWLLEATQLVGAKVKKVKGTVPFDA